jgi:hypothetical protein
MATSRGRVPARFDDEPFGLDTDRYPSDSRARDVAELARRRFEDEGVPVRALMACDEEGRDGTRLGGLLKVYLPLTDAPAAKRPFGMVFDPIDTDRGSVLNYVAFGVRHHPRRSHTPTVYEIAHRRLHGRSP